MARNSEFFLGANNSTIIKLGGSDVKIYLGSTLIYQPRISISSATVSVGAKTYNGSSQIASSITVSLSGTTLVQGADYQVTTNSGGTNVGNYTVTVTGLGLYKDTASGTFTINKVTPTVTAPTAKVLTYNGTAQTLANAGSTNFGTIKYSLNNSTWSTSIPTATNYGSYTLYYKVDGDNNVNSVSSKSIACSISEKSVTATVTLSQSTYTYSGSACTPTVTVKDGTTTIPATEYTVTYSNNVNAGTATVTIIDNEGGNYNVIGSTTFTINKATGVAGVSGRTINYSRGAQNLVTVSGNTGTVHYRLGTGGSWSTTIPTSTNASTYTVYYYVDSSANYNAVGSSSSPNNVSTTINKVTPVTSTAPALRTGLTYTGSAQNLLSGGAMKHSSSDTTAVSGTFTYTQQTTAGTYNNPTWSFTPTDTTNYNTASGTITGSVTIAKATGTATVTNAAPSYNGSARNLVTVSNNTGTMHYRLGTGGSWTTTIPTSTNAGSYDVYWYMDASTNYNGLNSSSSPAKVTCSIAKIDPTITAPTAKTGLTYTGSAQTLWNAGSNTTPGTFNYSTGTNAGSYTATWTFTPTDTTNYNSKNGSASVSIAKAAGSISYATTSVNKTYGNSAFTNSLTKSGDGSVTYGSSATGVATVNSSGQVTIVGAGSATITATVTDGTNYTYATKTASYTLSVAKATPTVTAPTAKSLTYSGAAQTLINAGSTTGGTLQYKLGTGSYSTSLPSATNKGSYTVYYKVVGNSNYNDVAEASISVSIGAKTMTITAKAQTVNYGTAITTGTGQVTTSGLVSGDSLTGITLTQSTTDVTTTGIITPSAATTTKGAGNYSITYNTGTLTITAVSPTKTDPTKKTGLTFSGAAQALVNAGSSSHGTFTYKLSTTSSYGSSIPTGTNAGTYAVDWKFVADANHGGGTSTGSITGISIATKALTITAKAQTVNYGTSITQGVSQVTTSGLVSGDSLTTITLTQSTQNVTTTGTITPSAAAATKGISNYNVTYSTGTLTINAVTATVTTAPSAKSLTYTSNAQALVNAGTPNGGTMYYHMTTSNSKPSSTTGFSTAIPTGTNAGTYYVWYYVKADSNHTDSAISSSAVSVTIARAAGTGSVTMSGWTYGNTVTNPTPTSSTNGTSNVTYTWYNSSKTALSSKPTSTSAVGTYYVKATFAATTNYKAYTTDYVSFSIAQREVTLSWGTLTWTYDKTAHSTTCTAGNLVSGDTCTVTLTSNSITNKGTTTVIASSLSNGNYKLPSANTNTLTVNARTVTLSWGTISWVYDGSTHSTTCTAGNLCSGDTCTVTLSNNSVGPNINTTGVTVTASSLSNSNYKLPSSKTNTLKITVRPINVTASSGSKTYDGTALTSNSATAESTGTNRGLVSGHSMTSCTVTGTITTKGTANNVPSAAVIKSGTTDVTSNYSITYVNGTLTVTTRAVTSTATNQSWVYDGSSHSASNTGSTTNLPTGHTATYTCTGSITDVGTATKTLSAVIIKNSSGTDVSSSFTITKINGTLTVTTNFKPSDSDSFMTSDGKYFVVS